MNQEKKRKKSIRHKTRDEKWYLNIVMNLSLHFSIIFMYALGNPCLFKKKTTRRKVFCWEKECS